VTTRSDALLRPPGRHRAPRGAGEQLRSQLVAAVEELLAATGRLETLTLRESSNHVGSAAKNVKMPILFCICDHDSVTPPEETLAYARTVPRGEIKTYDAGHFDIYLGEPFETVVADQTEFLTRHLKAGR
jgi:pimeloyl-ACP methyl ester carboxylesterase